MSTETRSWWYVIHTKPKQEARALLNLSNQGYECFLPRHKKQVVRRAAVVTQVEPLFSRYLFIQLDTNLSGKSWGPIRSTLGVSKLVVFGNEPARVESGLIHLFKQRELSVADEVTPLFKTGVDVLQLGVDRFNPYRRLINFGVPSLARLLQQQGYRTICVHPYPASFYKRDKLFPMLGFDQFVDISEFEVVTKQRKGDCHFVGDDVVADKVLKLLGQESEQPTFVFVITMENHGPLHLESLPEPERKEWLTEPLPEGCEDLGVYLRHLGHADQMIKTLTEGLASRVRPATLAWYGDHVPIMEKVYQQLVTPDGDTDYFIWRTRKEPVSPEPTRPGRMPAHLLAAEILKLG